MAANTVLVDGIYSFDVVDSATSLLNWIYRKQIIMSTRSQSLGTQKTTEHHRNHPSIILLPLRTHSFAYSSIYDPLCVCLTGFIKCMVVLVNYLRSPEHRYPCAYEDGWKALRRVIQDHGF